VKKLKTTNRNATDSLNNSETTTLTGRLKKALPLFACLAGMALVMPACGDGVVYNTYRHTQAEGWDKTDTLFFDVLPLREAGVYRQTVGLRINESFPFNSVTLVVDCTVEPKHKTYSDTLRCRLTDNKGNMLGRGVSYYQYDFTASDLRLDEGDSLHIGVRHIMRRETLRGIADVGLQLSLAR